MSAQSAERHKKSALTCIPDKKCLNLTISRHFEYDTIPKSLENKATLVDAGTHIRQDLRRPILDGALSPNMYGLCIGNHWDLGFYMFSDHEKFHAYYIESDVLHPNSSLERLNEKSIIIWATQVLQQWT
ncbi:hypothetical protein EAE96_005077 [Botrytis aclada]|nr:hypothetical protein EAE96_005077 [Botrytis aclada]